MSEQRHEPSEMSFNELISSLQKNDAYSKRSRINIDDLKPPPANRVSFVFGANKPIDPIIFNPRKYNTLCFDKTSKE